MDHDKIALLLGVATQQQKADVERVIDECLEKVNKVLPKKEGYERPEVKFDLRGRTAGYAGRTRIRLNVELLHNPETYDEMLNQTLPHEVAHCIVFQYYGNFAKAHGYEWRSVMRILGLRPDRTHDMPTKKARQHQKFAYTCKGCGNSLTFGKVVLRRLNEGTTKYSCTRCGTQIPQGLGSSH